MLGWKVRKTCTNCNLDVLKEESVRFFRMCSGYPWSHPNSPEKHTNTHTHTSCSRSTSRSPKPTWFFKRAEMCRAQLIFFQWRLHCINPTCNTLSAMLKLWVLRAIRHVLPTKSSSLHVENERGLKTNAIPFSTWSSILRLSCFSQCNVYFLEVEPNEKQFCSTHSAVRVHYVLLQMHFGPYLEETKTTSMRGSCKCTISLLRAWLAMHDILRKIILPQIGHIIRSKLLNLGKFMWI